MNPENDSLTLKELDRHMFWACEHEKNDALRRLYRHYWVSRRARFPEITSDEQAEGLNLLSRNEYRRWALMWVTEIPRVYESTSVL